MLAACAGLQGEAQNEQGEPIFASLRAASSAAPLYESSAEDRASAPKLLGSVSLFQAVGQQTNPSTRAQLLALAGTAQPYRMGAGDVILVRIGSTEDAPPLAITQTLDPEGVLDLGDWGAYRLAGLSAPQAEQVVQQALIEVQNPAPSLSLEITQYHSQAVRLQGEIYAPGDYYIDAMPMSLAEAITRAGGLLERADLRRITLHRQGQNQVIDLQQLYAQGLPPESLMLRAGDVLSFAPKP